MEGLVMVLGRVAQHRGSFARPVDRTLDECLGRPRISVIVGLAVSTQLFLAAIGLAQTVDPNAMATNGPVNTILNGGSTIYIGGDFTFIGPVTGGWVAIDASTGAAHQPYAQVAGAVNVITPDGSGGWYLGGSFTTVSGQSRNNIAQLDAGGNLTPWNPNANGQV